MSEKYPEEEMQTLEFLIKYCVDNKIPLEDWKKCKCNFDEELWEEYGLCVLLWIDVFKSVKDCEIFDLFIGTYSMSSKNVAQFLLLLIDSHVNELKTSEKPVWREHAKMCLMLQFMLEKGGTVIDENVEVIFEYIETVMDMCEDGYIYWATVPALVSCPTSKVKRWLIQRLDWLIKKLNGKVVDWNGHRNVSELIYVILCYINGADKNVAIKHYSNVLDQQISYRIFAYMMRLLDCEKHDLAKVMAIVNLELMCVTNRVDTDAQNKLRQKLRNVAEKVESAALHNQQFNSVQHQLGWCARWSVHNLWDEEGLVEQIPRVKLSPDRFEARHDALCFSTVRSAFGVTAGVFYYEVVLITQGWILIGWSTRDAIFGRWDKDYKVGDKENSIAFDLYHGCIVNNNIRHPITNLPPPQSPNVVGCLIDTHNHQFVFYLNEHKIDCPIEVNFDSSPYYATASLYSQQHCRFNFGQEKFKYPPEDIILQNDKVTNVKKFQLIDTEENETVDWFVHPVIDKQVDLLFRDTIQDRYDDYVRQFEHHLANNLIHNIIRFDCTRFIQSIIEVMNTELEDDECIRDLITNYLKLRKNMGICNFTSKMFELIYPYTQLQFQQQSSAKCHNLGIILISILNLFPNIPHVIYKMSLNFLLSTKLISIETLRRNAQLVTNALSGFDAFKINERTKRMLQNYQYFKLTLEEIILYGKINISDLYDPNFDAQALQAAICAKWWIDQLYSDASDDLVQATLNPRDRSALLKLSSDLLSARSDFHWQSVRSIDHNCSTFVESNFYYFEVILLTDGSMRIGWATRKSQLNESQIGNDCFSISFDGFNRAVRHQGEVYQQTDIDPWKAKDVIGCLIDKINRKFAFSLNGQQLSLPSEIHFSSLPYHAAVSLSPHQQVYFNFGQAPFKYGPQHIDYLGFHEALYYSYRENLTIKQSFDFSNAQLNRTFIAVGQTINNKNISFNNLQETTSNVNSNKNPMTNFGQSSQFQLTPNDYSTPPSPLNHQSISRPLSEKCNLCTESSPTKLVRFACCTNPILCGEHVKLLPKCTNCDKKPATSQFPFPSASPTSLPVSVCRLCEDQAQTQTRIIRFLCCHIIYLCLDCIREYEIYECPNCTKNHQQINK